MPGLKRVYKASVRWLPCLLVLVLSACTPMSGARLTALPLPPPAALSCCQQIQERIQVLLPDQRLELQAAVALLEDRVTVVILDSLGRRVVTLEQTASGLRTDSSLPKWNTSMSHMLMVALYLHHLDLDTTNPVWPVSTPGWSVTAAAGERTLRYRDRMRMQLQYLPGESRTRLRRISVSGRELQLTIETVQRSLL